MPRTPDMVRLLDADPDLGALLTDGRREQAERNPRLGALLGNRLHGAFVQREGRANAFARDFHVGRLTLDPDPAAA